MYSQTTTASIPLTRIAEEFQIPDLATDQTFAISDTARVVLSPDPNDAEAAYLKLIVELSLSDDGTFGMSDVESLKRFASFIVSQGVTIEGGWDGKKADEMRAAAQKNRT